MTIWFAATVGLVFSLCGPLAYARDGKASDLILNRTSIGPIEAGGFSAPRVFRLEAPDFEGASFLMGTPICVLGAERLEAGDTSVQPRSLSLFPMPSNERLAAALSNNLQLNILNAVRTETRYVQLEPKTKSGFDGQYILRIQERDDLLPDAVKLDAEEIAYAEEMIKLEKRKPGITARWAEYNPQLKTHQDRCNPTPAPMLQWCLESQKRLMEIWVPLMKDNNEFSADLAAWYKNHDEFVGRWGLFKYGGRMGGAAEGFAAGDSGDLFKVP